MPLFPASTNTDNEIATAQSNQKAILGLPEPKPFDPELYLPRFSSQQLMDAGGIDMETADGLRLSPSSYSNLPLAAQQRLQDLALRSHNGSVVPEHDSIFDIILRGVSAAAGAPGVKHILGGLEWYNHNVSRPTAAIAFQALFPGDVDMEIRVRQNELNGMSFLEARAKAFDDDKNQPNIVKAAIRLIADPANIIPFGTIVKATKAGLLGAKILEEGVKAGTLVSKTVYELPKVSEIMGRQERSGLVKLAEKLHVDKVISKPYGFIDPSRVVKAGSPAAAMVAFGAIKEAQASLIELAVSHVQSIGNPTDLFGLKEVPVLFSAKGLKSHNLATKVGDGQASWGDIFQATDKTNKLGLNNKQLEYVLKYHEVVDAIAAYAKSEGVPLHERQLIDDMVHFTPRVVKDIMGGTEQIFPNFQKSRTLEYMNEGVQAGINYANPDETLRTYLNSMYSQVALHDFNNTIKYLKDASGNLISRPRELGEVRSTEGVVRRAAFSDTVFVGPEGRKMAADIEKVLENKGIAALQPLQEFANVSRTLRATIDFSAPFVQGLPLMFSNPVAWGKATKGHIEAILNPAVRARYVSENAAVIAEFIDNGGQIGSTEFTELLRGSGYLAKVTHMPLISQPFQRFQTGFETFVDMGKIETYKGLRVTLSRNEALKDAASFSNKIMGTLSTKAMGVGTTQRQLESSLLFFAARYTRATMSVMLDATKGGLKGDEARKAMSSMLIGGAAFYRAASQALGQEPEFNPNKSNFMRVKINDTWVGFGTKYRSVLRLAARMQSQLQDHPEQFLDPRLLRLDAEAVRGNVLAQWLISNEAPPASAAVSILHDQDPIGRTIPLDTPLDWTKFIGTQLAPFSLQAAVDEGQASTLGIGQGLIETGFNVAGFSSSPVTNSVKRSEMRDSLARTTFKKPWEELAIDERSQIERNHPDLVSLDKLVQSDQAQFAKDKQRAQAFKELDLAQSNYIASTDVAVQALEQQQINMQEFRERVDNAGLVRASARRTVNQLYPNMLSQTKNIQDKGILFDRVFNEYMDRVFNSGVMDEPNGFAKVDVIKAAMRTEYGKEMIDRVEKELHDRKVSQATGIDPLVIDLFLAREQLRPYRELYKTILSPIDQRLYEEFHNNPQGAGIAGIRMRQIENLVSHYQQLMRRENVETDWNLVKWYGNTPMNQVNIRRVNSR